MSGHSHWAKVKRGKAVTDSRRGQVWGKLAKRIMVAARNGGGKPDDNLMLRYAIEEARAASMPIDTIDRAIRKATGELGAVNFETILYEGYGPGGVAFLVDCLTDNRSRTGPELRTVFERHGGQLGGAGSVAWMFRQRGVFAIAAAAATEDALMELALDAGAEDVTAQPDGFEVICESAAFAKVKQALADKKIATLFGKIAMVPSTLVPVAGDKAHQVIALMDALEEHDDVQNVYANFDIPDEILAQASK